VAVLREVKYLELQQLDKDRMPDEAQAVYARNETFRQWLGHLGIAVAEYNRTQQSLLDVEAPLLLRELTEIDNKLQNSVNELNWNSPGVAEYCSELSGMVDGTSNRLIKAKANVDRLFEILESFYEKAMLIRDEKTGLLPYTDRARRIEKTCQLIRDSTVEIDLLVRTNANCFRADKESDIWLRYLDYLDGLMACST
jgi:dynein heavy chain